MCVALPGRVVRIDGINAVVDFNGNQVNAITGLKSIKVGDRVLVHAGCILQKVEEKEADDLAELLGEIEAAARERQVFGE